MPDQAAARFQPLQAGLHALRRRLEKFKNDLLDLTMRNQRLNFRQSESPIPEKRRRYLRITHKIPDALYTRLTDGKPLSFIPLPEPDTTPLDEKTEQFKTALRKAKREDKIYQRKLKNLDSERKESTFERGERRKHYERKKKSIEIQLIKGVRRQLGLPPRPTLRKPTAEAAAQKEGLDMAIDLPDPDDDPQVNREWWKNGDIHLPFFPEDMERALDFVRYHGNNLEQSSGVAALYAAFGFLEWKEQEEGTARFAPLALLRVAVLKERQQNGGRAYTYSLEGSEENAEANFILHKKIKRDFRLNLPEFNQREWQNGDDKRIAGYWKKVEDYLEQHRPDFKLKRWVTIGIFSFSTLTMYEDIESEDMAKLPLIQEIMEGKSNGEGGGGAPPPVDSKEMDKLTPFLVMDCDSSQHQAIAAVAKGQSLAIEGPPGTGKSQTIVNMIASALGQRKKVLFVAQKVAALDVVHKRLKKAKIDDFCLHLHSHRAQSKAITQALQQNMERARHSDSPPPNQTTPLPDMEALRDLKNQLNEHHRKMSNKLTMDTIWRYLGAWSVCEQQLGEEFVDTLQAEMSDAEAPDKLELRRRLEDLEKCYKASHEDKRQPVHHPWRGLGKDKFRFITLSLSRLRNWRQATQKTCDAIADLRKTWRWADFPYKTHSSLDSFIQPALAFLSALSRARRDLLPPLSRQKNRQQLREILNVLRKGDALENASLPREPKLHNAIESLLSNYESCTEQFVWPPAITDDEALRHAQTLEMASTFSAWLRPVFWLAQWRAQRAWRRVSRRKMRQDKAAQASALRKLAAYTQDFSAIENSLQCAVSLAERENSWKGLTPILHKKKEELQDIRARLQDLKEKSNQAAENFTKFAEYFEIERQKFFGNRDILEIPFKEQYERAQQCDDAQGLERYAAFVRSLRNAKKNPSLNKLIALFERAEKPFICLGEAYDLISCRPQLDKFLEEIPDDQFDSLKHIQKDFRQKDKASLDDNRLRLSHRLRKWSRDFPEGRGGKGMPVSKYSEAYLVNHEANKQRRHIPTRELLHRASKTVQALKPCLMMSPLSVAHYLKRGVMDFDLLIVDEASQMKPEYAIGALARARQAVVVGDSKQLPPTDFFSSANADDEDDEDMAPTAESILGVASNTLKKESLLWHYRSLHPALISFSNKHFYNGNLIVFPSPRLDERHGLEFRKIEATYSNSVNKDEIRAVVAEAGRIMREESSREQPRSMGIVAINTKQSEEINIAIESLKRSDAQVALYAEKLEKQDDGLESLFVRNLENVQGDERDIIIISMTYGPAPETRRVAQRFGPINRDDGYRRLNVLFTRAREKVIVFSSMDADEVQADGKSGNSGRWSGRWALKRYLEYAANDGVMEETGAEGEPDSPFEEAVIREIEARGYKAQSQVGVAGFRIDVGVKHEAYPDGYLMGIECDGAAFHSTSSARDRDRLRQQQLEALGWKIYRIWSTEWLKNFKEERDDLYQALDKRLEEKLKAKRSKKEAEQRRRMAGEAASATRAPAQISGPQSPRPQLTELPLRLLPHHNKS